MLVYQSHQIILKIKEKLTVDNKFKFDDATTEDVKIKIT